MDNTHSRTEALIADIEQAVSTGNSGLNDQNKQLIGELRQSLDALESTVSNPVFDAFLAATNSIFNRNANLGLIQVWLSRISEVLSADNSPSDEGSSEQEQCELIRKAEATFFHLNELVGSKQLTQFLDSLPTAANRLHSPAFLLKYLSLTESVSTHAPKALTPYFNHLDRYLSQLTISGLETWAMWGIRAFKHQDEALNEYFSLRSSDSLSVFQQQKNGLLFVDIQRQLHFFLRFIWGEDFWIRPFSASSGAAHPDMLTTGMQPTIVNHTILLPDAMDDYPNLPADSGVKPVSAKLMYRAVAAHCAAHLHYSSPRRQRDYTPHQQFFIGLIEDARVEALAIREFPGLKTLWTEILQLTEQNVCLTESAITLIERIVVALLNRNSNDSHPLVTAVTQDFNELLEHPMSLHADKVTQLGSRLAKDFSTHCPGISLSQLERLSIPYRDDNQWLWPDENAYSQWAVLSEPQVKKTVNVMEMVNEIDCELADDDAQEIWVLESEFFRDGDPENISMNQLEGTKQVSTPFLYPEWDYRAAMFRPNWATVTEHSTAKGAGATLEKLLDSQRPLVKQIQRLVETVQPRGLKRLRKQTDGDDFDLDALIDAYKEIKRGTLPDLNLDQRLKRHQRDLSVLVLLDLSESTNEAVSDSEKSVLDTAKEATTLLASAIEQIGDPFAIHGFSSNGRHDVQYQIFKAFEQSFDEQAKSKLAGAEGKLSTRMGAALRHAGTYLAQQPQHKKLLLLLTDGEPSDIDERDPEYLNSDTHKAVDELLCQGITPYCLSIDKNADTYIDALFGQGRYTILNNVARLPSVLPNLFASLTKHAH